MNTKGMKFLAVLAVLAMAFAVFAVVSDVQQNDAYSDITVDDTYKSPGSTSADTTVISASGNIATAHKYVVVASQTITSGAVESTVYVKVNDTPVTLTIESVVSGGKVTVIPVTEGTDSKLFATSGVALTFVNGCESATFTANSVTTVSVGATGKISTGTIPAGAEVKVVGNLEIIGKVINNGILNIVNATKNTARILLSGEANLVSEGDVKGTIVVDSLWDSAVTELNHAIGISNGTLEGQTIIGKNSADRALICVGGTLSSGIQIKDNTINIDSTPGQGIVFEGINGTSENKYTVQVSNNKFISDDYVEWCFLGRGSNVDTTIIIKENDLSGIKGYDRQDPDATEAIKAKHDHTALSILYDNSIGKIGTAGVLIQTDITTIGMKGTGVLSIKDDMELDYLGIVAGGKVIVDAGKSITNDGHFIVGGTLEFERTTNESDIKNIGLQGTGTVTVKDGGVYIANQGKSGSSLHVLASGANKIIVNNGGKMFVHQAGASGKYWYLVGDTLKTEGEPQADNTAGSGFMIQTTSSTSSVSIQAEISGAGEILYTTYTFKGAVSLGSSHEDSINDYFGRKDVANVNGTLTLGVPLTIRENVTFNVLDGAKITPAAQAITLSGTIVYADAAQVYKNTTVVEGKGNVIVKGSGGDEEPTVIIDKTDVKPADFDNADVVVTTGTVTAATVPADKTLVIEAAGALANPVLDVTAAGSAVSIVAGTASSFTVKLAADSQIAVTGFTGSATFSKGSIVINGVEAFGAIMTLADKDVVKLSGAVGTVTFNNPASGSAEILVLEDMTLAGTLTYGDKISMGVFAEITGTGAGVKTIVNNGKMTIASGAVISGITISGTNDVDVYSGSDINNITDFTSWAKVTGKDENGGTWTWDAANTKFKLNGYNGTYNFSKFTDDITKIEIKGVNSISGAYKATDGAADNLIGDGSEDIKITTSESGSLTINVDISKVPTENLFKKDTGLQVLVAGALEIDGVDIAIKVTGENDAWTEDDFKVMKIKGIVAKSLTADNSNIDVSIAKDLTTKATAANVIGISTEDGVVTVKNADSLIVESAGSAITSAGNVTIETIAIKVIIDGNMAGISAAGKSLSVQNVIDMDVAGGIAVQNVIAKKANIDVAGTSTIVDPNLTEDPKSEVTLSSSAALYIAKGTIKVNNVAISQEATLSLKDVTVASPVKNEANLFITGKVSVTGSITNEKTMSNTGTLGIYGAFTNNGTFTNEGVTEILGKKYEGSVFTVTVSADDAASADHLRLASITLTKITPNADGTASVEAKTAAGEDKVIFNPSIKIGADYEKFTGTLTPLQTGAADNSYELVLSNDTATIRVVYDATKSAYSDVGGAYTISVEGYIITDTDKTMYLEGNKTRVGTTAGAHVETDQTAVKVSTATFANTGIYNGDLVTDIETDIAIGGTFTGNLTSNGAGKVTVGDFTGNVIAGGAVEVAAEKNMTGNIAAAGNVTISGILGGDILSEGSVSVVATGYVMGNITVMTKAAKTLTVAGEVLGNLTFMSLYKANKDDTIDTIEEMQMYIAASMKDSGNNFVINMTAAKDAVGTEAGAPGYLSLGALAAPDENKVVIFQLTKGKLVSNNVTLPVRYMVTIEKDTVMEVTKGSTLNVKNAALVVSKDATSNFNTDAYGKVTYKMAFDIEDGAYSIYSNVAYALTVCEEGSTLEVGESDVMTQNIEVKNGVNIIVDDVTLDFSVYGLVMGEGSKITLQNDGKVIFGITGDNTGDADREENEYYTISGTIVYDDNVIELDEVRFTTASNTFKGVEATSTAASKIDAVLTYNCGDITIEDGYATGTVELLNGALVWKDATAKPTLVRATFVVGADAVFDAKSLKDSYGVNTYKESGDDFEVDDEIALPTLVGVEGILNLLDNTSIKGIYAGAGVATVAKKLTLEQGDLILLEDTEYNAAPTVLGLIVTDKDGENKLVFNLVQASTALLADPIVVTAEKIKEDNVLTIAGDIAVGAITGEESVYLKGVSVAMEAAILAPEVYVIAESWAVGSIGAQDIYMKSTDSSYAKLNYEVEFEKDEYKFYSCFVSIDFDEITDLTIADSFDLSDLLELGATKLDLTGKDVSITVAEGKALTIDVPLFIGNPEIDLGDDGSALVGKFIIDKAAADPKVYLVAYNDVDLTFAEIYQDDGKTAAVYSFLDIEDILYATIFANEDDVVLSEADKKIVPEIEGYTFTQWINYGPENAMVGETNAYAGAKAISVLVIVKFAEGVSYYLDGVEFAIYDTPTKVEYNSVFTAKINNTAKYQGTPLINGQNSFIVTEDATLTVSGVTPIPEPTPEPVEENTGLSLTDILLIVLVILIAIMVVILVLRLNRS